MQVHHEFLGMLRVLDAVKDEVFTILQQNTTQLRTSNRNLPCKICRADISLCEEHCGVVFGNEKFTKY